jgi:DNA-binding NtrC family response regulator
MTKPRVLIVDDDAEIRSSLPTFLKMIMDCDIVIRSNGSDAIDILNKEEFQIIIQDLQMPGIDGFTVLNHAIKRHPKIIKIVLTGLVDPAVTRKVETMGAVYVSKPPELKVLELIISRELQGLAG